MRYAVALFVVLSACAHKPKDVAPVAQGAPAGPVEDMSEAHFEDIVIDGKRLGEAVVWSNGAHVTDGKNGERIGILEFELVIRNQANQPLDLDLGQTHVTFTGDKRTLEDEHTIAGRLRTAPFETQRIGVRYKLPSTNTVERLFGFDLAWALKLPSGEAFAQTTQFRLPAAARYEPSEWQPARYVIYPYEGRKPWSMSWGEVRDSEHQPGERSITLPPAQQQFQVRDRGSKPPSEGDAPNG